MTKYQCVSVTATLYGETNSLSQLLPLVREPLWHGFWNWGKNKMVASDSASVQQKVKTKTITLITYRGF